MAREEDAARLWGRVAGFEVGLHHLPAMKLSANCLISLASVFNIIETHPIGVLYSQKINIYKKVGGAAHIWVALKFIIIKNH